eukprot:g25778.t1
MGHVAVAEALLQAKAAPNTKHRYGYTALLSAGFWGRTEVAALLLKAKADMTLKDGDLEKFVSTSNIIQDLEIYFVFPEPDNISCFRENLQKPEK